MSSTGIDSTMLAIYSIIGGGTNILVYCIGIVAGIIFWRRAPRSAAICIGAMVLLMLLQISGPLLAMLLGRTLNIKAFVSWQAGLNAIFAVLHAIGIAALVLAIFLDRRGALRQ